MKIYKLFVELIIFAFVIAAQCHMANSYAIEYVKNECQFIFAKDFELIEFVGFIGSHKTTVSNRSNSVEFLNRKNFHDWLFESVILTHNRFLTELHYSRKFIRRHAGELASLVKSFPDAELLDENVLQQIFASPTGIMKEFPGEEIFNPWISRWSGSWSDGSSQFHEWEQTRYRKGQWIQPVIQSETEFSNKDNLKSMFINNQVDLGINVYTPEFGITGWVSKYQHGRLELPHIGYLYDETTLIWFCQPHKSNKLSRLTTSWFVFLERVDSYSNPGQYMIYGLPFVIENGKIGFKSEERGKHCGTYNSVAIIPS